MALMDWDFIKGLLRGTDTVTIIQDLQIRFHDFISVILYCDKIGIVILWAPLT